MHHQYEYEHNIYISYVYPHLILVFYLVYVVLIIGLYIVLKNIYESNPSIIIIKHPLAPQMQPAPPPKKPQKLS